MLVRPATLLAVALTAVAIGACGGSEAKDKPADPTAEALSYLPAGAPLAIVIDTDPGGDQIKAALSILRRAKGSDVLIKQLRDGLTAGGTRPFSDFKQVFGNPLVAGAPTVRAARDTALTFAIVGRDQDALKQALADGAGVREDGEYRGVKLYRSSTTAYALDGPVLVFADTPAQVKAALDVHAGARHLTATQVDRALAGLPEPALLRVYGNAARLLSGPGSASAREVTWVGALTTFGATVRAEPAAARIAFRLNTNPAVLEDADVPIAPGPRSPALTGEAPVRAGLRDLSHTLEFLQTLAQRLAPAQFERLDLGKTALRFGAGVDLDADLIGQFTGSTSVQTDLGRVILQSDLRDPERVRAALVALRPLIPTALEGAGISAATVGPVGGSGFDEIVVDGRSVVTYGVADGRFVAGNTGVDDLVKALDDRSAPLPGSRGALAGDALAAPVRTLLGPLLSRLPPGAAGLAGLVAGGRGWVQASITALRGEATVDLNG